MSRMASTQEPLRSSLIVGILAAAAVLTLLLFFWNLDDLGAYSFYEPLATNDFITIENQLLVKLLVATGAGAMAAELLYYSMRKKHEKEQFYSA